MTGHLAVLLSLLSTGVMAADVSCPVPGHGAFAMTLPADWTMACGPTMNTPIATHVRVRPSKGNTFEMIVTAVWLPLEKRGINEPAPLRTAVKEAGELTLPQAVETAVTVAEIVGPSMHGAVFTLTDKAPGPGEFKYMMQGFIAAGELSVAVTFLFRDNKSGADAQALRALKSARQVE